MKGVFRLTVRLNASMKPYSWKIPVVMTFSEYKSRFNTGVCFSLVLSKKIISGVDANNDGTIEPIKMEGGLTAVMEEAQQAGLLD